MSESSQKVIFLMSKFRNLPLLRLETTNARGLNAETPASRATDVTKSFMFVLLLLIIHRTVSNSYDRSGGDDVMVVGGGTPAYNYRYG